MATYDYSNGKIYTIRSHQTNKYYIGSTRMKTLAQRLGSHRSQYKRHLDGSNEYISSFEILKYSDHYIELLENYPCSSKEQLFKREGELQRQYKRYVVNLCIAGRTMKDYLNDHKEKIAIQSKLYKSNHKEIITEYQKQYNTQYYIDNLEKITLQSKLYREEHKEYQKQYTKHYRELNKEAVAEQRKQYYEANKVAISEKVKQTFTCECGSFIQTCMKSRHLKTTKHLNYIQQQTITQSPATITEPEINNLTII